MNTHVNQSALPFDRDRRIIHRRNSKVTQITELFMANPGYPFRSDEMHRRFGSSFRTRVSDINRDPDSLVTIKCERVNVAVNGTEEYVYFSEVRR